MDAVKYVSLKLGNALDESQALHARPSLKVAESAAKCRDQYGTKVTIIEDGRILVGQKIIKLNSCLEVDAENIVELIGLSLVSGSRPS
ncbi:MAG: hypothetical protein KAH24_04570 [Holophagae bacterium]|nr:hypothetical protein [Holophagae bacterium]